MSDVDELLMQRAKRAAKALGDAGYDAGSQVVPVDGPVVVVRHDGNRLTLRTAGCQWKFGVLVVAECDEELVDGIRRILGKP